MVEAVNVALTGLMRARDDFEVHARNVVRSSLNPATHSVQDGDLVSSVVGLRRDSLVYSASASVLRAADEMTGTLLHILA